MRYFMLNLAIHCVVLVILIMLVCIFAKRNKKRKTKKVIAYFLPVVFAVLAILDLAFITAPRLMDISNVAGRSYFYDTGEVTEISFLKNSFVVDGKRYFINPMRLKIKLGDTVRIKHTNYSLFTVEVLDISNSETVPPEPEKKQ